MTFKGVKWNIESGSLSIILLETCFFSSKSSSSLSFDLAPPLSCQLMKVILSLRVYPQTWFTWPMTFPRSILLPSWHETGTKAWSNLPMRQRDPSSLLKKVSALWMVLLGMVTENVTTAACNTLTRFLRKWEHWGSLRGGHRVVAPTSHQKNPLPAGSTGGPSAPWWCWHQGHALLGLLPASDRAWRGYWTVRARPGTPPTGSLCSGDPCQPGQDVLGAALASLSAQSFLPSFTPQVSDLFCGPKPPLICSYSLFPLSFTDVSSEKPFKCLILS